MFRILVCVRLSVSTLKVTGQSLIAIQLCRLLAQIAGFIREPNITRRVFGYGAYWSPSLTLMTQFLIPLVEQFYVILRTDREYLVNLSLLSLRRIRSPRPG